MISVWPASQLIVQCGKNLNATNFFDLINVTNVRLCMMILLIELYLFKPLSETLTILQGRSKTILSENVALI